MNKINVYLNDLRSRLEPTNKQKETIQDRLNKLRQTLEADSYFTKPEGLTQKSYLHGSWLRNTMIRSNSSLSWDVDILVIYKLLIPRDMAGPNTPTQVQPQSVFNSIKTHLSNDGTLGRLVIKQDFPCVTVHYADDLDFEIMPVYYRHPNLHPGYSGEKFFDIPASHTQWKFASPFRFNRTCTALNAQFNGNFKPVVKLLKHWNNSMGKMMSSFLVENLAMQAFSQWTSNPQNLNLAYQAYIKGFFVYAHKWITNGSWFSGFQPSIPDEDGSHLDGYLVDSNTVRQKISNIIETAVPQSDSDDLSEWKKIFPNL